MYRCSFVFIVLSSHLCLSEYIEFNGYETLTAHTSIDGIVADSLSGITYNTNDNIYYMISDEVGSSPVIKGFYGITFNDDVFTIMGSNWYEMEPSPGYELKSMDTESIVFINNIYNYTNSFYIVSQEGHRVYDTTNELYLYYTDGTFISSITNQISSKFKLNNTEDNKFLESMSIDINQKYFVFSTEKTLLSDTSQCNNCLRISINNFSVVDPVDDDSVLIQELYELRYDLDIIDDGGDDEAFNGLSDIVIFENQNDDNKLYGLFLERSSKSNAFNCSIYIADLSNNEDDVSNCYSLSESECNSIASIDKTLLFSFQSDISSSDLDDALQYGRLNFESLSILYDENGEFYYDDNTKFDLVAFTDNNGGSFYGVELETFFVYLTYDINGIAPDMPITTEESSPDNSNILNIYFSFCIICIGSII